MRYTIEELTLGEMANRVVTLLENHLPAYGAVHLVYTLPAQAAVLLAWHATHWLSGGPPDSRAFRTLSDAAPPVVAGVLHGGVALAAILVSLCLVAPVAMAALAWQTAYEYVDRPLGAAEALRRVWGRLPALAAFSLLVNLLASAAGVLVTGCGLGTAQLATGRLYPELNLAGVGEGLVLVGIPILLGVLALMAVHAVFLTGLPALLFESRGPLASAARGLRLSAPHRSRAIGLFFLFCGAGAALFYALQHLLPIGGLLEASGLSHRTAVFGLPVLSLLAAAVHLLLALAAWVAIPTLYAVASVVVYFSCRNAETGFDEFALREELTRSA